MSPALLAFTLYDEVVTPRRKGETLLTVPLLRRSRTDGAIFVGLLVIIIYSKNSTHGGSPLTIWLLFALTLLGIYLFWIRAPKAIFKSQVFFFANAWIEYNRIKEMNLSKNGVMMMQLEQRRLLILVRKIDDLEKIYLVMLENK